MSNSKVQIANINLPINRREFLLNSFAASSSLMLYGCGGGGSETNFVGTPTTPVTDPVADGDTPGALGTATSPKTVVVIGAGAAGLVAAYELERAGHQVTVLEARDRSGGRIYTLRQPFTGGDFAEAGASRIPSNHNLTLGYASHFELALDPFYATSQNYVNLTSGQVSEIDAASYLAQPPWPGSVNRSQYQKLRGGMEQLPLAFENAFNGSIRYGAVVSGVVQDNQQVIVRLGDGEEFVASRVLCTVPLPVLGNIGFQPNLSAEKQSAINGGYSYANSSRLFSQFTTRFWENQGLNGWGNSDHPEEIWQPTWGSNSTTGIIQSYLLRDAATSFEALSEAQQVASVYERLSQTFPGFSENNASTFVHSWSNETYSGRAFAAPSSSQASALDQYIGTAEGRVHFAGEHASNFHAWIQGALESGIRAAQEIHTAAN